MLWLSPSTWLSRLRTALAQLQRLWLPLLHRGAHARQCVAVQGRILQRVDAEAGMLDNIVEVELPKLPLQSSSTVVRACLRHTYTVNRTDVRIVYESTFVEPLSNGCGERHHLLCTIAPAALCMQPPGCSLTIC